MYTCIRDQFLLCFAKDKNSSFYGKYEREGIIGNGPLFYFRLMIFDSRVR